jgi:hypothetical protein
MRATVIAASLLAATTAACAPPAVAPMSQDKRKTIVALSPEVAGAKHSNTSDLGARGSGEGATKGSAQAAAAVLQSGGSLLGVLIVTPLAAAAGAATGAASAKSEAEVDAARAGLRIAIQETDFTALLRDELGRTKGAGGRVTIVNRSTATGAVVTNVAMTSPAAEPSHLLNVDYQMGMVVTGMVVPDVQASVIVKTQVMTNDRRTVLHSGTWMYCGPKRTFIDASANNGTPLRADFRQAATVVAEAITYDTFAAENPRHLRPPRGCMDLADLPSGLGRLPQDPPAAAPPPDPAATR